MRRRPRRRRRRRPDNADPRGRTFHAAKRPLSAAHAAQPQTGTRPLPYPAKHAPPRASAPDEYGQPNGRPRLPPRRLLHRHRPPSRCRSYSATPSVVSAGAQGETPPAETADGPSYKPADVAGRSRKRSRSPRLTAPSARTRPIRGSCAYMSHSVSAPESAWRGPLPQSRHRDSLQASAAW